MALMEIRNLKKYFNVNGGQLHAVDDISVSIDRGQTLGIVGESGCGKSTLGKVLMRLETATEGEIIYDGTDLTKLSERQFKPYRRRIQMIFQDPFASLDQRMTVSQLIAEPIRTLTKEKDKKKIMGRARELMDMVGLARRLENTYPHELDGGRRQRIGIARALASEPELIVCDEPVSALDVSVQSQILNLLDELQKELRLTYIFIAHGLSVVKHISDRVGVMYLGKMAEVVNAEQLFENPAHPYTQALLSANPIPDPDYEKQRIILEGDIPSASNLPSGCAFHTRCRYCRQICRKQEPPYRQIGDRIVACHFPLE